MSNYTISFKSLRSGYLYTVSIGGGSGEAIPLKGAAHPFTTQEDDDDDMFTPIRTQSGYLRIVDDGLDANGNAWNWKDLLPTTDIDRPVTLTHVENGQTVVDWIGFMQAQNFGGTLYGNPQEREFPVQCVLSALSASEVDSENRELQNFAYLIKQAFSDIINAGVTIDSYIFQGGAQAREWLMKLVDWQNFVMDSDDGLSGRYDNQRIISDICAFWGWTCRTCGNCVYFTRADDNTTTGVLTLTQTELNTLANGTSAGTVSSAFLQNITLPVTLASVNNSELNIRGYNRAVVKSDGNPADENVMEAFPTSVEESMSYNSSYQEHYTDGYAIFSTDQESFMTDYLDGICESGSASFNKMLYKKNINDRGNEHNVVRIRKSFISASAPAFASFETVFHHSFYDTAIVNGGFDYGGFSISGDVYRYGVRYEDYSGSAGAGTKHIYLRIGVGKDREHALWWTGSEWSSTISAVKVRIGDQTPPDYLLNINTNHANMYGMLFVDLLGSDDLSEINGQRRFEFGEFRVVFRRRYFHYLHDQEARVGSQNYIAKNENVVRGEWNNDLIYASDNNLKWGYGVLMDPDGKWLGQQTYGLASKWPEQHLADRVAEYSETSKRKIDADFNTNELSGVSPRSTATIDGMTGHVVSISHEWRDDVTRLSIMEL